MGSAVVTYECADGIAVIGLNRPDKRNALSQELLDSLAEAAERAASEARVAIPHGTGPNRADACAMEIPSLVDDLLAAYNPHDPKAVEALCRDSCK